MLSYELQINEIHSCNSKLNSTLCDRKNNNKGLYHTNRLVLDVISQNTQVWTCGQDCGLGDFKSKQRPTAYSQYRITERMYNHYYSRLVRSLLSHCWLILCVFGTVVQVCTNNYEIIVLQQLLLQTHSSRLTKITEAIEAETKATTLLAADVRGTNILLLRRCLCFLRLLRFLRRVTSSRTSW